MFFTSSTYFSNSSFFLYNRRFCFYHPLFSVLCLLLFPFRLIQFASLFFIICSPTLFLCHPAGFISRHICPPSCQLYLPSVSPPSSRLVLFEAASLAARAKSQWSSDSVISSTMFRTMWLYRNVCIFWCLVLTVGFCLALNARAFWIDDVWMCGVDERS